MPEHDRLATFTRRLDDMLDADDPQMSGPEGDFLSPADREALDLARRLAALNPSQESRMRYPLRHRLLSGMRPAAHPWWLRTIRLSPGLALAVLMIFLSLGTVSSMTAAPTYSTLPTAYRVVPQEAGIAADMPHAQEYAPLIPMPVPTPQAPRQDTTLAPAVQIPQGTPILLPSNSPSEHQSAGSTTGEP